MRLRRATYIAMHGMMSHSPGLVMHAGQVTDCIAWQLRRSRGQVLGPWTAITIYITRVDADLPQCGGREETEGQPRARSYPFVLQLPSRQGDCTPFLPSATFSRFAIPRSAGRHRVSERREELCMPVGCMPVGSVDALWIQSPLRETEQERPRTECCFQVQIIDIMESRALLERAPAYPACHVLV
jgi:hypothetical protein